jgi:signal transduction histidine kinase
MPRSNINKKFEKILPLLTLMNQTNDINSLLKSILTESEKIFSIEGTSILLEDSETGKLFFYFATGEKEKMLSSILMEPGEGVCGYVFQTGIPIIENDPVNSEIFSDKVDKRSNFHTRNLICVPLQIKDRIIGVLELVNKHQAKFNEDDLEMLKLVGTQISLALERARLVEEKIKIERLASIGETIAGLSHYIKNILTGLQGGSYIINKHLKEVSSQKLETGWHIVNNSIERISSLVLDMLYYYKERKPKYKKINMDEMVKELIELYRERAAKKNISLHYFKTCETPEVCLDPKGIHRCLVNLISNSLDAFEGRETGNIWLKLSIDDSEFSISVSDDGKGMDHFTQKKLFTKFFSTKGSSGSGLGLPITKKIIDEHNGKIEVNSQLEKGTEFNIRLPLNV